ncbi:MULTISPECIES: hypothetical protein [Chromohalobacter]|uniref:Uncharacterized protein n=2 Tax=Chromohalobacter TaxID=42054 RepID=A0A9X3AYD0_9GAMM|nr:MULTISPECIES: hypothetical protein [Chromohalobacter]CDQ36138.1 chromosome segregation protein [Virgibacillus halodenitrificans]MCK0768615.1 hypothetical protein [Chromohalobacter canadensis]MCK2046970.1 hypothetical protein [Chromohalobacter moromii]MCT8506547.1 hypothetical protein [Chromohalobacter moromii]WQH09120.1 hypothetical protein SR908_00195 [Chromohalobacter canadensis]
MSERSEGTRQEPRIVPERDTDPIAEGRLDSRPRRASSGTRRRRTRVWPLWCLTLLLIVALAGITSFYWQERQAWQTRFSNLEARQNSLTDRLDATGSSLDASGDSLRSELDRLRSQLDASRAVIGNLENKVSELEDGTGASSALEDLRDRQDTQQTLIAAQQSSLKALESTGEDARATLSSRLESLSSRQEEQGSGLETLTQRLDELADTRQARGETLDDLQENLDDLSARVASLSGDHDEVANEVASIQDDLRELRQGQLALNANVEALSASQ